jgi:hypothetical protein
MPEELGGSVPGDKSRRLSSSLMSWLLALVATSIAVATFFGHSVDKRKQLELSYLAKLSLVSPEAGPGVKVAFDGRQIQRLTKVSARLINTGAVPIEERDIEQQPSISFDMKKAVVLKANLTENPKGVKAGCKLGDGNAVVFSLGLLNPGDWVGFELLFDGDPGDDWPPPNYRITGVSEPTKRVPSSGTSSFRVGFFILPRSLEVFLIIFASMVPIVIFAVAVTGAIEMKKSVAPPPQVIADGLKNIDAIFDPQSVLKDVISKLPPGLRDALGKSQFHPNVLWIDNPESIKDVLRSKVSSKDPSEAGNVENLSDQIFEALRTATFDRLPNEVFRNLPSGVDRQSRDAVRSVLSAAKPTERGSDLIIRAKAAAVETIQLRGITARLRRINPSDAVGFVILLVGGFALTLVMIGSWNVFLNGSR